MGVIDHGDENGSNEDVYVGHRHEQLDFRVLLDNALKADFGTREFHVDLFQDFCDRFDQVLKTLLQLCLAQIRDKAIRVAAW